MQQRHEHVRLAADTVYCGDYVVSHVGLCQLCLPKDPPHFSTSFDLTNKFLCLKNAWDCCMWLFLSGENLEVLNTLQLIRT